MGAPTEFTHYLSHLGAKSKPETHYYTISDTYTIDMPGGQVQIQISGPVPEKNRLMAALITVMPTIYLNLIREFTGNTTEGAALMRKNLTKNLIAKYLEMCRAIGDGSVSCPEL